MCDSPIAHVLPASDRQFIKERDGVAALYGCEERAVARAQVLVAATTLARVRDAVSALVALIRITRVDEAEVREQRDETPLALIDAVSYAMRAVNLSPRENLTFALRLKLFARRAFA